MTKEEYLEFRNAVRDFVDLHASKYEEAQESTLNRELATNFAIKYISEYSGDDEYDITTEYSHKFDTEKVEDSVGKEVALRVLNDKDEFLKATSEADYKHITEEKVSDKSSKILSVIYNRLSSISEEGIEGLYHWYLSRFPPDELSSLERNYTQVLEVENAESILSKIESPSDAKDAIVLYSRIVDVVDTGCPLLLAIKRAECQNIDQSSDLVQMNFGAIYSELDESRYSTIISLLNKRVRNGIKHGDTRVLPSKSSIRIDSENTVSFTGFSNLLQKAYICCEVIYGLPGVIGILGYERTDIDASVDF